MKYIKLTHGKITLVDDENFEKLNKFNWQAYWGGWNWYAVRTVMIYGKRTTIRMHREIMNAPEGIPVDHRNGNGLFNYKENLRLCTIQQNSCNRKQPHRQNKLNVKGVHLREDLKKFIAQIQVNGKKIHLGCFNALGDADNAYRQAEEKYFGEFARTK